MNQFGIYHVGQAYSKIVRVRPDVQAIANQMYPSDPENPNPAEVIADILLKNAKGRECVTLASGISHGAYWYRVELNPPVIIDGLQYWHLTVPIQYLEFLKIGFMEAS